MMILVSIFALCIVAARTKLFALGVGIALWEAAVILLILSILGIIGLAYATIIDCSRLSVLTPSGFPFINYFICLIDKFLYLGLLCLYSLQFLYNLTKEFKFTG